MQFLSPVVITGAMFDLMVQRAKMEVVLKHLPRCLGSSSMVRMFRVVADQLRREKKRGANALQMIFNVIATDAMFKVLFHQL